MVVCACTQAPSNIPVFGITYAANVTIDLANGVQQLVVMTGDLTVDSIDGLSEGDEIIVKFQQDGAGGHSLTLPGDLFYIGGIVPVWSTGANEFDTLVIRMVDGVKLVVAALNWQ